MKKKEEQFVDVEVIADFLGETRRYVLYLARTGVIRSYPAFRTRAHRSEVQGFGGSARSGGPEAQDPSGNEKEEAARPRASGRLLVPPYYQDVLY